MEFGAYSIYLVLEALILVSAYAVYLYMTNRRLLARQHADAAQRPAETLAIDRYTALLQEEILRAEAKLARLATEESSDPQLNNIIETRLSFLRGEREAIDNSGLDEEKFWTLISDRLKPFVPAEDTPGETANEHQSALIEALQSRIQAYATRVANLEQFKDQFFAIKDKYANTRELNGRLHAEIERALPEDEQSPELKETLQELRQQNAHLESQLGLVEHEFNAIIANLCTATDRSDLPKPELGITNSVDSIGEGVGRIKHVIAGQEQKIKALNGMLSELELELAEQDRIKDALEELQAKHGELSNVIGIVQEENNFLQEQFSTLLKQELEKDRQSSASIERLHQELNEQVRAYADLENRYAAMEREYLVTYAEYEKLKG